MEIELHPTVSLFPDTFNVLIAPAEMLIDALNRHLDSKRYKVLLLVGNYSRILRKLDRNSAKLEVRRAFTSFQFKTILEENHHTFLIVEHDPMLYDDSEEMVEYLAKHMQQPSGKATILLYAPAPDIYLEKISELASRVFCFYKIPRSSAKARANAYSKIDVSQATLEAYK